MECGQFQYEDAARAFVMAAARPPYLRQGLREAPAAVAAAALAAEEDVRMEPDVPELAGLLTVRVPHAASPVLVSLTSALEEQQRAEEAPVAEQAGC